MVATAAAHNDGPIAFRFPRGEGRGVEMPARGVPLEIGKGRMIREGSRVAILSFGTRLEEVEKAAEALAAKGITPTVADASVSAVLIACATEYFDTPLTGLVRGHTNLVGYMDRMKDRYFAKNLWPVPEMA